MMSFSNRFGTFAAAFLVLAAGSVHLDAASEIDGTVTAVSLEEKTIALVHGGAEGLFDAGETEFHVGPGDASILEPGDKLRAKAKTYGDGYRLDYVWKVDPISDRIVSDVNRQLRQDTVIRGSKAYRSIGEFIPNFALYNQEGDVVQARTLRGKQVVMNFIFTRCGMPQMCPASTERMHKLQAKAAEAGIDDLQLVTISFDPIYDTPGVLKQYAMSRDIALDNFMFLTGEKRAIDDLLKQFGVLAMQEDGTIKHTMTTLLIDEKGKIAYRKDGMRWDEDDFLKRLKRPS